MGLFFFHFFENLCEKYRHSRNNHEKDNFSNTREKYCSNTKYTGEKINNKSDLGLSESKLHKSEMKMVNLISFHWILSLEDTCRDNVDKIYEVDSQYRYCSCNLSSRNYSECCNQECEHNCSRVSHNQLTRYISSCQKKSNWNNNCE